MNTSDRQREIDRAARRINIEAARTLGTSSTSVFDVAGSIFRNVLAFGIVVYVLSLVY